MVPPLAWWQSRHRLFQRFPPPNFAPMTTLICDCNKTMALDSKGLIKALGPEAGSGLEVVHTLLCRREFVFE